MKAFLVPPYFSTFFVYSNNVLPPSFVFLHPFIVRGYSAIEGAIFPGIFNFEKSSYENIGFKFLVYGILAMICHLIMRNTILETNEKSRIEIGQELREE